MKLRNVTLFDRYATTSCAWCLRTESEAALCNDTGLNVQPVVGQYGWLGSLVPRRSCSYALKTEMGPRNGTQPAQVYLQWHTIRFGGIPSFLVASGAVTMQQLPRRCFDENRHIYFNCGSLPKPEIYNSIHYHGCLKEVGTMNRKIASASREMITHWLPVKLEGFWEHTRAERTTTGQQNPRHQTGKVPHV